MRARLSFQNTLHDRWNGDDWQAPNWQRSLRACLGLLCSTFCSSAPKLFYKTGPTLQTLLPKKDGVLIQLHIFRGALTRYSTNQHFVCPRRVGDNYPQLPLVTQIPFPSISSRRPPTASFPFRSGSAYGPTNPVLLAERNRRTVVDGVAAGDDEGSSRISPRVQIATLFCICLDVVGLRPQQRLWRPGGPPPPRRRFSLQPRARERPSRWGSLEVAGPALPARWWSPEVGPVLLLLGSVELCCYAGTSRFWFLFPRCIRSDFLCKDPLHNWLTDSFPPAAWILRPSTSLPCVKHSDV